MYTGDSFEISKEQSIKIKEWYEKLPKFYEGAIGGRISYTFTPTSIGTVLVVKDGMTGCELNVTDYENW